LAFSAEWSLSLHGFKTHTSGYVADKYPRELSIPSAIASKLGKTIMNRMELRGGAVGGGTAVCGSLFIWTKYFDG
jgi:hypothetical protein